MSKSDQNGIKIAVTQKKRDAKLSSVKRSEDNNVCVCVCVCVCVYFRGRFSCRHILLKNYKQEWLTTGTVYTRESNKGFSSRFCVGSRVRHETPEEDRRTYQPKRCEYNNSLNILRAGKYLVFSFLFSCSCWRRGCCNRGCRQLV